MSSDYGSDILSDDISAIESSQPVAVAEHDYPTPRKPLMERDGNVSIHYTTDVLADAEAQSMQHNSCELTDAPLYQFPFGAHKGKTLLEVPENYLAYLRIDLNMADSMPGFADALRFFDAGEPPIAPLPPPLPSQSERKSPSSSSQAQVPSSQQTRATGTPTSKPSDASPAEYRFDFGIHAGKTIGEVPSDYLDFLRKRGIVEGKPALAAAVIKYEREHASNTVPASSKSRTDPAQYTLKFGRHIGKTMSQVPAQYLTWLKTTEMLDDNEDLRNALYHHMRMQKPAKSKTLKRPRTPNMVFPSGKVLSWDGRRLDGRARYGGRRGR